ncbi:acyltransferase family protein [Actinomadura sp. NTSP31]|uniref:acyltransferase family protein n=1 Tax=Actinomadura sp. NTSP31 TaxID=1735447 RepID=UPI0035BEBB74
MSVIDGRTPAGDRPAAAYGAAPSQATLRTLPDPPALQDAPSSPGGTSHLVALDGIRAVASLIVVLLHTAFATAMAADNTMVWRVIYNGGVGVPIFFALSGLLLYRPWARNAIEGGTRPDARAYLWRRGLRILPTYWIVLAVGLIAFSPGHAASPRAWLEWATLTEHYDPNPWWDGVGPPGLGPVWSLSVEVSFYLLLPLLAVGLRWFAVRGGRAGVDERARRLLIALLTLTALSYLTTMVLRATVEYETMFYYEHLLPRSLLYFTLGMALSVVSVWAKARPGTQVARRAAILGSMPGAWWLMALCCLVLASTPISLPFQDVPQNAPQYMVSGALYPLIALGVVLPAALAPRNRVTVAVLGNRLVRSVGLISYGIYLWHQPIIQAWYDITGRPLWHRDFWVLFPVTMAGSLVVATVSYFAVEKPFQLLRDRGPGRRRAGPARKADPPPAR